MGERALRYAEFSLTGTGGSRTQALVDALADRRRGMWGRFEPVHTSAGRELAVEVGLKYLPLGVDLDLLPRAARSERRDLYPLHWRSWLDADLLRLFEDEEEQLAESARQLEHAERQAYRGQATRQADLKRSVEDRRRRVEQAAKRVARLKRRVDKLLGAESAATVAGAARDRVLQMRSERTRALVAGALVAERGESPLVAAAKRTARPAAGEPSGLTKLRTQMGPQGALSGSGVRALRSPYPSGMGGGGVFGRMLASAPPTTQLFLPVALAGAPQVAHPTQGAVTPGQPTTPTARDSRPTRRAPVWLEDVGIDATSLPALSAGLSEILVRSQRLIHGLEPMLSRTMGVERRALALTDGPRVGRAAPQTRMMRVGSGRGALVTAVADEAISRADDEAISRADVEQLRDRAGEGRPSALAPRVPFKTADTQVWQGAAVLSALTTYDPDPAGPSSPTRLALTHSYPKPTQAGRARTSRLDLRAITTPRALLDAGAQPEAAVALAAKREATQQRSWALFSPAKALSLSLLLGEQTTSLEQVTEATRGGRVARGLALASTEGLSALGDWLETDSEARLRAMTPFGGVVAERSERGTRAMRVRNASTGPAALVQVYSEDAVVAPQQQAVKALLTSSIGQTAGHGTQRAADASAVTSGLAARAGQRAIAAAQPLAQVAARQAGAAPFTGSPASIAREQARLAQAARPLGTSSETPLAPQMAALAAQRWSGPQLSSAALGTRGGAPALPVGGLAQRAGGRPTTPVAGWRGATLTFSPGTQPVLRALERETLELLQSRIGQAKIGQAQIGQAQTVTLTLSSPEDVTRAGGGISGVEPSSLAALRLPAGLTRLLAAGGGPSIIIGQDAQDAQPGAGPARWRALRTAGAPRVLLAGVADELQRSAAPGVATDSTAPSRMQRTLRAPIGSRIQVGLPAAGAEPTPMTFTGRLAREQIEDRRAGASRRELRALSPALSHGHLTPRTRSFRRLGGRAVEDHRVSLRLTDISPSEQVARDIPVVSSPVRAMLRANTPATMGRPRPVALSAGRPMPSVPIGGTPAHPFPRLAPEMIDAAPRVAVTAEAFLAKRVPPHGSAERARGIRWAGPFEYVSAVDGSATGPVGAGKAGGARSLVTTEGAPREMSAPSTMSALTGREHTIGVTSGPIVEMAAAAEASGALARSTRPGGVERMLSSLERGEAPASLRAQTAERARSYGFSWGPSAPLVALVDFHTQLGGGVEAAASGSSPSAVSSVASPQRKLTRMRAGLSASEAGTTRVAGGRRAPLASIFREGVAQTLVATDDPAPRMLRDVRPGSGIGGTAVLGVGEDGRPVVAPAVARYVAERYGKLMQERIARSVKLTAAGRELVRQSESAARETISQELKSHGLSAAGVRRAVSRGLTRPLPSFGPAPFEGAVLRAVAALPEFARQSGATQARTMKGLRSAVQHLLHGSKSSAPPSAVAISPIQSRIATPSTSRRRAPIVGPGAADLVRPQAVHAKASPMRPTGPGAQVAVSAAVGRTRSEGFPTEALQALGAGLKAWSSLLDLGRDGLEAAGPMPRTGPRLDWLEREVSALVRHAPIRVGRAARQGFEARGAKAARGLLRYLALDDSGAARPALPAGLPGALVAQPKPAAVKPARRRIEPVYVKQVPLPAQGSVQGTEIADRRELFKPSVAPPQPDISLSPLARVGSQSLGQNADRSAQAEQSTKPPRDQLVAMARQIYDIIKDRLEMDQMRFGR